MKSLLTQKGMSLVEMMVAGAITVGLGLVALNMKTFTERETTRQNLDIQSTISRYGGAMVLMHDLSASEMSFNFLNMKDDNDLPFFCPCRERTLPGQ
jgi:Tfp pilus assembly protein PilV